MSPQWERWGCAGALRKALISAFHAMDDMLRSPEHERQLLALKQASEASHRPSCSSRRASARQSGQAQKDSDLAIWPLHAGEFIPDLNSCCRGLGAAASSSSGSSSDSGIAFLRRRVSVLNILPNRYRFPCGELQIQRAVSQKLDPQCIQKRVPRCTHNFSEAMRFQHDP